jgi:hypothetical protein
MNWTLAQKRAIESLAMIAIGDGVLALLEPRRHLALWRDGPRVWRKAMMPFARRPRITRLVGAGAVVLGLWLASNQRPRS